MSLHKNIRHVKGEYWFTLVSWSVLVIGHFLIIAIASRLFDAEGLALFLVGRRILPLLEPISTVGTAVALPKFVAQTDSPNERDAYWVSSLLTVLTCSISIAVLMWFFDIYFSQLLFGVRGYESSVYGMALMLIGVSTGTCCYSYFRGVQRFYVAGSLNLLRISIIPVVAVCISQSRVDNAWLITGFLLIIMTVACIISSTPSLLGSSVSQVIVALEKIGRFGIQRSLANVIGVGLLSFPVIIATLQSGLSNSGIVAFGMTVVSGATYLFGALDIVLLPRASRMIANGESQDLLRETKLLLLLVVITSVLLMIVLQLLSPYIVLHILNSSDYESVRILIVMLTGILPYSIYMAFRGVIDARYRSVRVTINMLSAMIITLLTWGGLELLQYSSLWAILYGVVAGMYALGIVTVIDILRNN